MLVTGSSFRNSYMLAEIQQGRLDGHFDIHESSRLDFGVAMTEVNNRSAFSNVQQDSWGGATVRPVSDYPDEVWRPDTVRHYFDNISGSSNPNLFNEFFTWDFETVRQLCGRRQATLRCTRRIPNFTTDRRTQEDSNSAYIQFVTNFDTKIPIEMALGLRYEDTEVTSSALVPTAIGINWVANNEFSVIFSDPGFTTLDRRVRLHAAECGFCL